MTNTPISVCTDDVCPMFGRRSRLAPLVLHNKEILSVREHIASSRKNRHFKSCMNSHVGLDLTSEISLVLHPHLGPISYFRIDSCAWSRGSENLGHWLEINKLLPTNMVFPINLLQRMSNISIFKVGKGLLKMVSQHLFGMMLGFMMTLCVIFPLTCLRFVSNRTFLYIN